MGLSWLQPRHYEEIVDERVTDGRCGYPLCNKSVKNSPGRSLRLASTSNTNSTLKNYCSHNCHIKGQKYHQTLDETAPLTRKCVSTLTLSESTGYHDILIMLIFSDPSDIGEVLSALRVDEPQSKSVDEVESFQFDLPRSTGFGSQDPPTAWVEVSHTNIQSIYTPTLLSYDPVQSVPEKHTPLGSRPQSNQAQPTPTSEETNHFGGSEGSDHDSESIDSQQSKSFPLKSSMKRPATFTNAVPSPSLAQAILRLPIPSVDDSPGNSTS